MDTDIVSLAKEFIAIPSVTGDVEKAVEALEVAKRQLQGYTFTPFVTNGYPSLLYSNKGKELREFQIIINAHVDVVPASPEYFKPYVENGRLYGRGAFDMKAALAVNILVFKEMANKVTYPLALQLVADEETHGKFGTGYQVQQGVRGEFVLIGESNSNFRIGNQAKGRYVVKLTMKGESSHSAYSWLGKNAIWDMYAVLDRIIREYPIPKKETYDTTVSITKIETSNEATNRIPGDCSAYLDVRYTKDDVDTVLPKIKSLLPEEVTMEVTRLNTNLFVDPENKYIKLLQKETKAIRGEDLPVRYVHATSDAPFYSAVGCSAVEFGPVGEGAHHDNEWVDIESLEHYYQILKKFLMAVETNTDKTVLRHNKKNLST